MPIGDNYNQMLGQMVPASNAPQPTGTPSSLSMYNSGNAQDLSPQSSTENYAQDKINNDLSKMPKGAGEGWVKGYMARQQLNQSTNEDRRAEDSLNLTKEAFGWKRDEYQQQQKIQQGMVTAAQNGGYEGVIGFLQQVDPDRAIDFTQKKLSLDKSIMSNQVLQATSKKDITSAMAESYGVLGKMGYSILQAPPEDRQAMYDNMYHIVQTVNPDAPKDVNQAVPMFMLSVAQSIPENTLYSNKQTAIQAQSQAGKLQADIDARMAKGETTDNSPGLNNLITQVNGYNAKATKAQQEVNDYKYTKMSQNMGLQKDLRSQQNQAQQLSSTVKKDYLKDSDSYINFQNASAKAFNALTVMQSPDSDSAAKAAAAQTLQYAMAHINNGTNVLSDNDFKHSAATAAGYENVLKQMQAQVNGVVVPLNPQEVDGFKNILGIMKTTMNKKQSLINTYYQEKTHKLNDGMDTSNGRGVSINMLKVPSQKAIDYLTSNPTAANLQQFQDYYGYPFDTSKLGDK